MVATVITGAAVVLSAGVAQAGSLDGGGNGDDGDHKSHHKSHSDSDDSDDSDKSDKSDDSDCRGCVDVEEECCEDDEPVHYEYECADGGLQDIPGFGAVPVVATSDVCGEDEE